MTKLKQTPSQTVGPYFAYGLCPQQYGFDMASLFTPSVATLDAAGEHITIIGNVYDGEGQPVGDAMVETLQANAHGQYIESAAQAKEAGFSGFARVGTGTDPELRFTIETVKPGRIDEQSAPHIDAIIMMRGMLLHCYTRIYFEDEAEANALDPVLSAVPAERRDTLLARRLPNTSKPTYRFDVRLQGAQETVFFDV